MDSTDVYSHFGKFTVTGILSWDEIDAARTMIKCQIIKVVKHTKSITYNKVICNIMKGKVKGEVCFTTSDDVSWQGRWLGIKLG